MANSAFWRDLAVQFSALRDKRRLGAGGANDSMFISALETLAMRGASEIAVAGASDLLHIWLEELRKEGLPFQSSGQSNEVLSEAEYSKSIYKGFIDGLCEASATFCKRREAQAVQAEFEEKQRNNPKNWSQLQTREGEVTGALLSSYRSEIKRAILMQLALKPKATDGEICRGLDDDGSVELPSSWKSKVSDRGFFDAYSDAVRRHKVEVTISKVRIDLRKQRLLD